MNIVDSLAGFQLQHPTLLHQEIEAMFAN